MFSTSEFTLADLRSFLPSIAYGMIAASILGSPLFILRSLS